MSARVVNLYKEKYDIYIGRPGKGRDGYYGNPFPLKTPATESDLAECLRLYREYFYQRLDEDIEFRIKILALKEKVLGCFCKPKGCHGDVIVEYLEGVQNAPG